MFCIRICRVSVSSTRPPGWADKDFQCQAAEEEGGASQRNLQQHMRTIGWMERAVLILFSICLGYKAFGAFYGKAP